MLTAVNPLHDALLGLASADLHASTEKLLKSAGRWEEAMARARRRPTGRRLARAWARWGSTLHAATCPGCGCGSVAHALDDWAGIGVRVEDLAGRLSPGRLALAGVASALAEMEGRLARTGAMPRASEWEAACSRLRACAAACSGDGEGCRGR